MNPQDAAAHVMNNDISEFFEDGEVVTERRPAKVVTALRMDLSYQAKIEAVAAELGMGASTLMRQIIEEWIEGHDSSTPKDQVGEIVRRLDAVDRDLDAVRRAVSSLASRAA